MRWLLIPSVLLLAGCGTTFGWSPEQLSALKDDGACVAFVGNLNAQLYGNAGSGAIRLNSPGTVSVAKDGTISCTIIDKPKQ